MIQSWQFEDEVKSMILAAQWHPERFLIDSEWGKETEQKFFEKVLALCEQVKK